MWANLVPSPFIKKNDLVTFLDSNYDFCYRVDYQSNLRTFHVTVCHKFYCMCIFQESFEQEAEEYECSVEKLYPLCDQCEEKVTNEISHRNHVIRPHLLNSASKVRRNKEVCMPESVPFMVCCECSGK